MQLIIFYLGSDVYGIDTQYILEVVPKVHIKKIPNMPEYVLGLADVQGKLLTVVDFTRILIDRYSSSSMDTRIIFLEIENEDKTILHLGMVAEKAVEIVDCDRADFLHINRNKNPFSELPYLDGILQQGSRTIQLVDAKKFVRAMIEILN